MKYGFVILHYMAYGMTRQCVDLILSNFSGNNIFIVIVDNFSPNGSGKKLENDYGNNEIVKVILNKENIGFAKGNNIGYSYLRDNYDCDFIVVMNNDVLIEDDKFLTNIGEIYSKTAFDVLGPDIINPKSKNHQSPVRLIGYTDAQVRNEIKKWKKYLRFIKLYYVRHYIFGRVKKIIPKKVVNTIDYTVEYINPVLQGACYIFSSSFIKLRECAFNPATFLYFEEEILQLECRNTGLKMIYSPQIFVYHLEDVATNTMFKSNYSKDKMKITEMMKSMEVFLSIYNQYRKEK